jgi:hypothetical protein
MIRSVSNSVFVVLLAHLLTAAVGSAQEDTARCQETNFQEIGRNPSRAELRCRHGVTGPGRFGLLSYADVPVYQPATPMPGTHLIGVPGQARPQPYETFEEWEWRVLGMRFGADVHEVHRDLETLHPDVADRIRSLEARLATEGIRFSRRETWRSPRRQAYLFQQGRSRPGPLATATLTSWHAQMDEWGRPAGRAVDYDVPGSSMKRFHEIAAEFGLMSFGDDSNDPGHVFLPLVDALPPPELALLRTIPRVPEVTLATGLPVDRRLPPGGRDALRTAVVSFAAAPFTPPPLPSLAATPLPWQIDGPRLEKHGVRLAAADPAVPGHRLIRSKR